jgi:hypothetical protein
LTPEGDFAAQLARRALAEAAPEELPLFRATSQAYFDDPDGTLARRGGRDELLGFGVEGAIVLMAPVALDVAKTVVAFVVSRIRAAAEREGGEAIDNAVERFFARFRGGGGPDDDSQPAADAELSPEQLDEVRQVALERARALDLPEAKAVLLADAVVGGLV